MKPGLIAICIIFFAIIEIVYITYCPSFPRTFRPEGYAFWRVIYYLNHYSLMTIITYLLYKKSKYEPDKIASFGLFIYSIGKGIFYIFLINKDLPTYIQSLNSKFIDISLSLFLWVLSIIIWNKRFNILKLIKYERRP